VTGGLQGVEDIVRRITSQATACPKQTFALVGYSQGASVMHRAADRLPLSVLPRIKSVVMFGDPYKRLGGLGGQFPYSLRARVLQLCADGDPVSLASFLGISAQEHVSFLKSGSTLVRDVNADPDKLGLRLRIVSVLPLSVYSSRVD
jgi:pimeloyl-ACP methyl ester carboxylesterase